MDQVEFVLENEQSIRFELADNAFARRWLSYFKEILNNNQNWKFTSINWNGYTPSKNPSEPLEFLEKLKESFVFLNDRYSLRLEESIRLLDETISNASTALSKNQYIKVSQEPLNRWHRNFTSLMLNQLFNDIKIDLNDPQVFHHVHSLNEYVHRLETVCSYPYLSRRIQFAGRPVFYSYFTNANDPGASEDLWNIGSAKWVKERFDPLVDNVNYNVWLNEDILGKDLVRCWLDFDNQHSPDITGNLFLTPGLIFDPHYNYRDLLTSAEWIENYKQTHKTLDRFPIGNIVNMPDWELLDCSKELVIKSIKITEDIPYFTQN